MPNATHWTRCTAQRKSGNFCDAPSLPDVPFPICLHHASELFSYVRDRLHWDVSNLGKARMRLAGMTREDIEIDRRQRETLGVVYYVRLGDVIKIGTSQDVATRVKDYPPHAELLATEMGGPILEAERHHQFNEYLTAGREWFIPGARLVAHITHLIEVAKQPHTSQPDPVSPRTASPSQPV